ncbi:hypothetical protein [Murdochiella massiliensis]|uniref:hypothetical protein n=1 Tax=Murdochiella massiliensis TaxID=1673723 RepID=UPI00082EDF50|nr:hypothetical protein [Murdochiella massiliensis]
MKKKVMIGAAIAVVVVALAAIMVFVFTGKEGEHTSTVELDGTWKVAVNVADGSISIPQNEYMVFDNGEARDYRDGNTVPYVKSTYKVSGDVLELPDISRTYHISQKTEQYVSLYTNDDTYMTLVKADNESVLSEAFSPDTVTGKWNVTYRPTDKPIANEYLVFGDSTLADFRDNAETPTIEADYEWSGNVIKAPALGIEMSASIVGTDRIILVDANEGYVWLLTKATEN